MINEPLIVGAGPVGLRIANNLARAGFEPLILEEHDEIGSPVQCAGLISTNILKVHKPPAESILNRVYGAKFISSNNSVLMISKKVRAFVIDRRLFDKSFINDSLNILRGHKVLRHDYTRKGVRIKTERSAFSSKMLIDCSGPKSDLKLLTGIQARARLNHDSRYVELHFNACKDFFGWVVPESDEVVRIGLATAYKPREHFNAFLKKLGVNEVIELNAGMIPMSIASFCGNNFIRVGDSAGQVKATTGGGVITGLLSADVASRAVIKAYEENDFSRKFFINNYYKPFNKSVGRGLRIHHRIRSVMNNFSDKDFDELISFLEKNKRTLLKHGDMDFPAKCLMKMLLKPGNWSFILKAIK